MNVRVEVLKLRTVRSTLWLLLGAQLIVVAGVSGLFVSAGTIDGGTTLAAVDHAGLVSIFSLVLGILAVAGEHRHRTITDTYLGTPVRDRVIGAKLAVYAAGGGLFGLASAVTAMVATAVWLAAKGTSLDLGDADLWQTLVGCVLWNSAFAAIGVGLGALIRNLPGAIAVALAWLALVEGIVGQLLKGHDSWLPFASGLALESATATGRDLLAPWQGGLLLAGYAAAFWLLAISTTVKRDVS